MAGAEPTVPVTHPSTDTAPAESVCFSPEIVSGLSSAKLVYTPMPNQAESGVTGSHEQNIEDAERLAKIEKLFSEALVYGPKGIAGCPFQYATLVLSFQNGTQTELSLAMDSCTLAMTDDKVYNYMPPEFRDPAKDHPDNRILMDLFDTIPWPER